MRLTSYGAEAVLVQVDSPREAAPLAAWLRERLRGALEVVPAAETVLVDGVSAAAVEEALRAWRRVTERPVVGPLVEIPVRYAGPDLDFVAEAWGVKASEVGGVLAAVELTSAFCGFAPGFAYLAGLPAERHVPRLETPRSRVEAGSVALAGPWCGIYPTDSPGGWRVVGRTDAALWDATRADPALLAPGVRVRLVEA